MNRNGLKALIKRTPGIRLVARVAERALGLWSRRHFSSSDYWEARYRHEGDSGSGSYNRLSKFKAEVLNGFVRQHEIATVIEFGSGDGSQLNLATYPNYIGIDVSQTVIGRARARFASDLTKKFFHIDELEDRHVGELAVSLDVIYHLVEDPVFQIYMERLFTASLKYVIIYSSNFDRRDARHVMHRKFTDWVAIKRPDFILIQTIENPYPWDPCNSDETSFADFFIYERSVDGLPKNG